MANHAEAGRHVFQLLGHVFAERRHRATARLAGFVGLRQVRSYVARQILRQRLALYLFRYRARCLGNLDGRSAFVGFEIFQFQFELLDLAIQFLGAADRTPHRIGLARLLTVQNPACKSELSRSPR